MDIVKQPIEDYCIEHSTRPSSLLDDLAQYTRQNHEWAQMMIGPLEASVLGSLIIAKGVERILEIGTYTGYSSLAMAEFLPENGKIHTIDIEPNHVKTAKMFAEKSEVGHKIEFHLGAATEVIPNLKETFDLVFIDADKENYSTYFDMTLEMLNPRGIIALDNALWSGRVLEDNPDDTSTKALQAINDRIKGDDSLFKTLLPVRDGIFLVQKR